MDEKNLANALFCLGFILYMAYLLLQATYKNEITRDDKDNI